jgi:hypothetical protein
MWVSRRRRPRPSEDLRIPRTTTQEGASSPNRDVQRAFDTAIQAIEGRVSTTTAESRALAALRDALLPKLISGEVRVKDANKIVEKPRRAAWTSAMSQLAWPARDVEHAG